jgi:recombination protein RecT
MTHETLPTMKTKVETVRDLILKNRAQIELALPKFMNTDRLIRTALTSFSTTPALLDCTPRSLLGAVIQCAQLGLEPGIIGMAYLVPFHNKKANTTEVQFIPGYRGLLALARRSGEISTIQAHCVYAEDAFVYRYGLSEQLDHTPAEKPERGPMRCVYAVARLKDGGHQFDVMTKAEVDTHRDRYSRAAKQGPWQTEYPEMAKKTVLRRLCKLLPASVELQTAVALDERAELQLPQGLTDLAPDEEEDKKETPSRLDALWESMPPTEPPSTKPVGAANDITG